MTELKTLIAKAISILVIAVSVVACSGNSSSVGFANLELLLESAGLSWDAPTENTDGSIFTDISGYKIYYGTSPDAMNSSIAFSSNTQASELVDNLDLTGGVIYYFAITAVNSKNIQSKFSNIVFKTVPESGFYTFKNN